MIARLSRLTQLAYDPLVVFTPPLDNSSNHNNQHHPDSKPPQHVWVRQRQDDTFFLLPEALAAKEIDVAAAAVADCDRAGGKDEGVFVTIPPGEGSREEEEEMACLVVSAAEAATREGHGGGCGGVEWRSSPFDEEVNEELSCFEDVVWSTGSRVLPIAWLFCHIRCVCCLGSCRSKPLSSLVA